MDFSLSPQEEAFRKEVSDWLDENMKELPEWWGRVLIPLLERGFEIIGINTSSVNNSNLESVQR